jgi:hypothetical protein
MWLPKDVTTSRVFAVGMTFVLAMIILGIIFGLLFEVHDLRARVLKLEHACIPTYTGGGVWQCKQPDMLQAPPTKKP